MLRSLYAVLGYSIAATDGACGRVQDFLFDEESWIVHYLVVEKRPPKNEAVLILPFAAGQPDWATETLPVPLTCDQIRTSPPFESDIPISRQRQSGLKRPGSHLRSTREILGYRVYTTEGEAGVIEDLIVEDTVWDVHRAVIALKRSPDWLILLPVESIRSISWPGKAAWVNLSLAALEAQPEFDPAEPVNADDEQGKYDYYGRRVASPSAPLL